MGVRVTGWGTSLPTRIVSNSELAGRVGVAESWISERTGIASRHVAGPAETSSSLAIDACREAIACAGRHPEEIDLVIVATMTPDTALPPVSCLVQSALGASRAAAFDLNAACTGFIAALSVADALLESGPYERILVCGADVLTKIADYDDASSCVLFGDGAGAVLVEKVPGAPSLGGFSLYADGSKTNLLFVGADDGLIHMKGREVYRYAVEGMAGAVQRQLDRTGTTVDDLDLVVAHQANARIVDAVAERLGLPAEKVVVDIAEIGNTSAASIPIALARAAGSGRLHDGARVMLVAFGGGFTWGAGILGWGTAERSVIPAMAGAAHE